jgi:hypothetical protein
VAAMISSFFISIVLLILNKNGIHLSTHLALIITVLFTTVTWVITAFVGPQTDKTTLIEFYKKIRPFGPGWKTIRAEAGITEVDTKSSGENIPLGLLGWFSGCTVIWSSLFTIGNFLYGRTELGFILLAVFIFSGIVLIKVINKLWSSGNKKVVAN